MALLEMLGRMMMMRSTGESLTVHTEKITL